VHAPRVGAVKFPFAMTVNPNDVDAPAARFPLPLGRMVITLPLESQVGDPFHVAETRCGDRTVTVVVQFVMAVLPARTVT